MTRLDSIRSILIVTSSSAQREVLQLCFSSRGFDVDTVADGSEAIKKFELGSFDLVLSDLQRRDCGGNWLAEHLHENGRDTPMIAIASVESHAHPQHEMVFQKPFRMEALFKAIQALDSAEEKVDYNDTYRQRQ